MPCYCFFDLLEIYDEDRMDIYREGVLQTVDEYGGRYLAIGGRHDLLEGNYKPVFPILLEFPDYEVAVKWYHSQDYSDLKKIRLEAVDSNAFLIDGL